MAAILRVSVCALSHHVGRAPAILLALALSSFAGQPGCASDARPPIALTDEQFWSMSTRFSEPAGAFAHSENLVSNEIHFADTIRMLRSTGGAYIGVGPEQNFSYIERLRPAIAFIIDIRPENRNLHLMYKALFELSADRADFLSRLFSRQRPSGVGADTPVRELFEKYETAGPADVLYEANARLIRKWLLEKFPLSPDDLAWVEHAFHAFYADGPGIHYGRPRPDGSPSPSYRDLMTAADVWGMKRSYLATEDGFAFVKHLQEMNAIVPVVGDFAGPSAIRRAGDYSRQRGVKVSAFYASNVEVYLNRQQLAAFCGNLSSLPHDSRSWFIGSNGRRLLLSKLNACVPRTR